MYFLFLVLEGGVFVELLFYIYCVVVFGVIYIMVDKVLLNEDNFG